MGSTAPTTGGAWVSIADGLLADFGFPIVVHPHRPETVYVFPLVADDPGEVVRAPWGRKISPEAAPTGAP